MIDVSAVTKRYGRRTAVDDLSFTVRPGVVTGFLGPNGAGKSTTLRVILGLDAPDAGGTTVCGVPFASLPRGLRHAGALLDAQQVHGGRTARAHLAALARSNGLPARRVAEVLGEVGLDEAAGRRVGGFSLGMKQRLGVAAALLGDPPVLLFDEPFNGMDPEGVRWLRRLFRHLAAEGRTVFLSSHLMSEMESTAEELIVIGRGRLVAAEPLRAFAARAPRTGVVVGAVRAGELAGPLTAAGAAVTAEGGERLVVTGLPAARIGALALEHGIGLHELTTRTASLEEAFMELTADRVEYPARAAR
ncbi:ATP-binding cassette domain-containing protein [Streptomyces sp. NPDC049813]|uniref:ATP-binding cassette domain-containing protein n=1 Tax=Streptomyces sp. NPDC049813 TaxID=3365597 RepID=UPI0037B601F5